MSDRMVTKKEARRQRRQDERAARARTARREKVLLWGGAGVAVVILGLLIFRQANPAYQPGTTVISLGNQHLRGPDEPHIGYNTTPPTSGPHMGGLWKWGISDAPILDEWQVHNLEDGGVIIQYDCPDDCPELQAELTAFFNEMVADPTLRSPRGEVHLILAPYSGIRAASGGQPIALTAWTRILYLDTFDRDAMQEFIRAYINLDHHIGGLG